MALDALCLVGDGTELFNDFEYGFDQLFGWNFPTVVKPEWK